MTIKKELEEQRKGQEVIPFRMPELATAPTPPGDDWLRRLPHEARFVAKPRNYQGPWLTQFGIAAILPECIMVAIFSEGRLDMKWVDSRVFSRDHTLVTVIPTELGQPAKGEEDG